MANHDGELSILFTDDKHISQLNRRYLDREEPTNVLAFPMSGGSPADVDSGMLGDIVISLESIERESKELGETSDETISRLLIHGILLYCFHRAGALRIKPFLFQRIFKIFFTNEGLAESLCKRETF